MRVPFVSGILSDERFWQGFSLTLSKEYDLSRIDKVVIDDGAPWVKDGAELFSGLYELDRFHKAMGSVSGFVA